MRGSRSVSRCLCFLEVLEVFVFRFSLKIVGQKLTTYAELIPTSNCTRPAFEDRFRMEYRMDTVVQL
jgi:hypothetical protein